MTVEAYPMSFEHKPAYDDEQLSAAVVRAAANLRTAIKAAAEAGLVVTLATGTRETVGGSPRPTFTIDIVRHLGEI